MPDSFCRRLRAARLKLGLRQIEVSHLLGINNCMVSHYEIGLKKPSFKRLRQLCCVLDVSADYLLGLDLSGGSKRVSSKAAQKWRGDPRFMAREADREEWIRTYAAGLYEDELNDPNTTDSLKNIAKRAYEAAVILYNTLEEEFEAERAALDLVTGRKGGGGQ